MNFVSLENYMHELCSATGGIDTQIVVKKDGKTVYSFCGGFRDAAHKIPAAFGDCFYYYSLSKPVTCTAAMQLYERGLLDLEAPVSHYLPYFQNASVRDGDTVRPAARDIRVWHLFAMQSGFNYDEDGDAFRQSVNRGDSTNEVMQATVESIPFSFDAGEHWQYSCRNHDALGCIIEKISGMGFDEYLQKNIFAPLGMSRIGFRAEGEIKENLADIYKGDGQGDFSVVPPVLCRGYTENYLSGGQGLMGDLNSYSRFADAMANGGVSPDGVKILNADTLDIMRSDRLSPENRADFWRTPFGYGYGLGVRTLISKQSGALSNIGEFGWDGAAGAYTLFDPEARLSITFLTHCLSGNEKLDQFKIRDLTFGAVS